MKKQQNSSFPISVLLLFLAFMYLFQAKKQQDTAFQPNFTFGEIALKATVKVEALDQVKGATAILRKGSGAIISEDGLIVTNYHNIGESMEIEVTLYNGIKKPARLVIGDPQSDLALLRIEQNGLPYFALGDSRELLLGETVYAIGNPQGLNFSLSTGTVSAVGRRLGLIQHPRPIERFIQTDVRTEDGCDGGPLLNQQGELVGINTFSATRLSRFEGYSFAQPVELASELLVYSTPRQADARFELEEAEQYAAVNSPPHLLPGIATPRGAAHESIP